MDGSVVSAAEKKHYNHEKMSVHKYIFFAIFNAKEDLMNKLCNLSFLNLHNTN